MRGWLAAALVALAACGGGDQSTPTTVAPTTTSVQPTTLTLATTTTVLPPAPQASPDAAADAVIGAWRAGDRDGALQVGTVAAVDELFAIAATSVQARGCTVGGADPSYCVYRTDVGELRLRLSVAGEGWILTDVVLGT